MHAGMGRTKVGPGWHGRVALRAEGRWMSTPRTKHRATAERTPHTREPNTHTRLTSRADPERVLEGAQAAYPAKAVHVQLDQVRGYGLASVHGWPRWPSPLNVGASLRPATTPAACKPAPAPASPLTSLVLPSPGPLRLPMPSRWRARRCDRARSASFSSSATPPVSEGARGRVVGAAAASSLPPTPTSPAFPSPNLPSPSPRSSRSSAGSRASTGGRPRPAAGRSSRSHASRAARPS